MPKLVYTRVNTPDVNNITVYQVPNFDEPFSADSGHVQWNEILRRVEADDVSVLDLFNIANTLMRELVSDRIQIAHGRMFFDGDEIDESLSAFVVKMIGENHPDYQAFIKFVEKLYSNPQEHSRDHLFTYLRRYNVSITTEGDLILYKGVYHTAPGESFVGQKPYRSGTCGPANVSGYEHTEGYVPQDIGDVITMPRSKTWGDPTVMCSTGLHVATYGEWHTSYPIDLAVLVNPRDVVSVPGEGAKIRCCRYKIIGQTGTKGNRSNLYTNQVNDVTVPPIPDFDPDRTEEPLISISVDLSKPTGAPTAKEFNTLKRKAKMQRKGLRGYMLRKGWVQVAGADGSKREDWYKPVPVA